MMHTNRSRWTIPVALIALSGLPAVMGVIRLGELARRAAVTPDNARFFAAPVPVTLHISAVIPFTLLGALQFAPSLRGRSPWHRIVGRSLLPCGLVAALSGLWMTLFYPWPEGDGVGVYVERLVFGSAMLGSLVLAVAAVRRHDFAAHGAWMTRAYAIGLGAGTQVLTHLPWFLLVDRKPGEGARTVMMGAAWVINVFVAEWVIRRRQGASRQRPIPSPPTPQHPLRLALPSSDRSPASR